VIGLDIYAFSFTQSGAAICARLAALFSQEEDHFYGYTSEKYRDLFPGRIGGDFWREDDPRRIFRHGNALIFISAIGIAVRKIAPYLKDKTLDPAVIVVDEQARHVIPILSGHIGGANALAARIAAFLGAACIVTTATDLQNKFAVDEWAEQQGLAILNPEEIKYVSAAVLDGAPVGLSCDFRMEGDLPAGFRSIDYSDDLPAGFQIIDYSDDRPEHPDNSPETGVAVTLRSGWRPFAHTLILLPRILIAGMGCRKGTAFEAAESLLLEALVECGAPIRAAAALATIDLKENEPAFHALCEKYDLPLLAYSAAELNQQRGGFHGSDFVRTVTGTDNVCERAALLASQGGELILSKRARGGVTVALARKPFVLRW
jgi:cobalt-precorrin 5A hydrolase